MWSACCFWLSRRCSSSPSFFSSTARRCASSSGVLPPLLALLMPALSMRLVAEERRRGTWEILSTLPFKNGDIVVAKFAAVWVTGLFLLLPTVIFVVHRCRLRAPRRRPRSRRLLRRGPSDRRLLVHRGIRLQRGAQRDRGAHPGVGHCALLWHSWRDFSCWFPRRWFPCSSFSVWDITLTVSLAGCSIRARSSIS